MAKTAWAGGIIFFFRNCSEPPIISLNILLRLLPPLSDFDALVIFCGTANETIGD